MKVRKHHGGLTLCAVAAGLSLTLMLLCASYRHESATMLPPLSAQLGKVALKQGVRCEAVGDLDGALAHYTRALAGNLSGAQDRVHAEKRCGVVLWELERFADAIPHLQRAQSSPLRSLNGYRPLVECLAATGKTQEAETVAQTWLAETEDNVPSRADALRALGQLALLRGDGEGARQYWEDVIALAPAHEARVDLAQLEYDAGNRVGAMAQLSTWLSAAPPGRGADDAWELLERWAGASSAEGKP